MNFEETLNGVELVMRANEVPLIVGKSGIGKTTLVKRIAEKNKWKLVVIDGNLLKEGEIGGLPTIDEYIVCDNNGNNIKRKTTVYASHTKLREIDRYIKQGDNVLLFIDEINRCEHSVQQELMNLILNREINGYVLDDNVKIVAAMNPSDKYGEEFEYQVVDMDPAQENRFVWLHMDNDSLSWIRWAQKAGVDEKIIEFISTFPDYLYKENEGDICATPRSYERLSKIYKIYKEDLNNIDKKVFVNIVKGNVGRVIAEEFIGFIESHHDKLITLSDILSGEEIDEKIISMIKKENHTRLYIIAHNILDQMNKFDFSSGNVKLEPLISSEECLNLSSDFIIDRFVKMISYYPADLMVGIMKEMKQSYGNVYNQSMKNDCFIESYYNAYGYAGGKNE